MEDTLAIMWSNLSLSKNEASTIVIDPTKLSIPQNALVGKLAMRKHINLVEMEKGLRVIWGVANAMEVTTLGENLFMFSFSEATACERVLTKWPWNYRGSILLLGCIRGDEYPSDLAIQEVSFWIQLHGLQLRAMNRSVGEEIGSLLGKVIEVNEEAGGSAIGRCLRVRAMVNIHNPF